MDAIQRSKTGMGMTARDYLLPNSAITTPLPNFTTNFTIVQNTLTQILAIAELQDFAKQGIKDSKNLLKLTLCSLSADGSRKLTTYAKFTNNSVLLREIKISESELKRLADTDLKTKAQEIYDRAQTNIASLASYGITAATQTALLNAINAFVVAIPKPRLGIDERKQATQQLVVLFKTLDMAWDNIDAAIEIVRVSQSNFYNGYRTARKIIDTSSNSLSLKIKATNAITGEPEANVTISITPASQSLKLAASNGKDKIVKKTAKGGGANVKNAPDGMYNFTATKPGFKDLAGMVTIVNGESTVLEIKIEKS